MEEPTSFFPVLNAIVTSNEVPPLERLSPEALEEVVVHTAHSLGYLRDPGVLESTKLQIALHAASPKIEAFYQFYAEQNRPESSMGWNSCGSWVDWYGERVCDVTTLAHFAEHDFIDTGDNATTNMYAFVF